MTKYLDLNHGEAYEILQPNCYPRRADIDFKFRELCCHSSIALSIVEHMTNAFASFTS